TRSSSRIPAAASASAWPARTTPRPSRSRTRGSGSHARSSTSCSGGSPRVVCSRRAHPGDGTRPVHLARDRRGARRFDRRRERAGRRHDVSHRAAARLGSCGDPSTGHVTRAAPLIVVADDDPDIVTLVSGALSKAGFEIAPATNGGYALELVRSRRPDLAVLDVSMPRLDGLEVLRSIRSDPELAEVPVILLSARAQEEDVKNGYAVGASKYMRKPFSPRELVAVARELLADQDGGL